MLNVREQDASSAVPPLMDWGSVSWQTLNKQVWKLQQRIYRAETLGQKRLVRNLQRMLVRSQSSLLLSIRRVTQINKGKRTAGVDGYKVYTSSQRAELYNELRDKRITKSRPLPAKRTYIDKGNGKLRPLGIPVIIDRVYQNVIKLALEPQWEAKFEGTSYGFRPKRSTHDALGLIFTKCCHQQKWIFEGDFKGCFDNLNHDYILEQIKHFPFRGLIHKWLKAGYVDKKVFSETSAGTPQGGIISPLLANIALHGMESELGMQYLTKVSKGKEYQAIISPFSVVRYADDFVIICNTQTMAESMYDKLEPYLTKRGLELASDKIKVTNTLEGFDFLGMNVRLYQESKTKTKLLIKPSKKSIKKATERIKETFQMHRGQNAGKLIFDLNPIIQGIANYWKPYVSSVVFSAIDTYVFTKTAKFLKHIHANKSWNKWTKKRYFKLDHTGQSENKWILTNPNNHRVQLRKMSWTPIERHVVIGSTHSPFDATLKEYFDKRDIKLFLSKTVALKQKMAKKQKYCCTLCGKFITNGAEGLEIHHNVPKFHGGSDEYKNLALVHIACPIDHHTKYPGEGKVPTRGELAKSKIDRIRRRKQGSWITRQYQSNLD